MEIYSKESLLNSLAIHLPTATGNWVTIGLMISLRNAAAAEQTRCDSALSSLTDFRTFRLLVFQKSCSVMAVIFIGGQETLVNSGSKTSVQVEVARSLE